MRGIDTRARATSPARDIASNSVSRVSSRRRARGAAKNASPLFVRIDPQMIAVADEVAERLGVSKAEFMEEVLRHLELNDEGVPNWWTRSVPKREETLPLTG